MEIRLEGVVTMVHGETRTFPLMRKGFEVQGFLIRYHQGYYAYLNMCCHWPVPMDLGDGDFFHADADRIRCKTHGAGYLADTGVCDMGPCINAQLESYPVTLRGDDIWVTVPD